MLMLLSGCVLSSMILSSDYRDNRNPARIEEMMRLIHEEGELPPFPTTATELWVQTSGNMFSRTFYGRYCDTPQAVDGWLEDAARLTEGLRPGWQAEYAGEEAWYTKLQRSESGACVDFQVSWS